MNSTEQKIAEQKIAEQKTAETPGSISQCYEVTESASTFCAIDFLQQHCGLSKAKLKDAMNKGAVWISPFPGKKNSGKKNRRLRRATTILVPGHKVWLYYDEAILADNCPDAVLLKDFKQYSVWYKPAAMLSQGTFYGDNASLLRQVEKHFDQRECYLIHRLDREASGLMVIAHTKKAAGKLSALFVKREVVKIYRVSVLGDVMANLENIACCRQSKDNQYLIETTLDGKPSSTLFTINAYDAPSNTTALDVELVTGRKHQIRRHFSAIGHPVMGDPKYGKGNKNTTGLELKAVLLRFTCPFEQVERLCELDALLSAKEAKSVYPPSV